METVDRLKQDNPEVDDWVIRYYAERSSRDPQAAIDNALEVIDKLKQNNSEVNINKIRHFAISNPIDPQAAIDRYVENNQD